MMLIILTHDNQSTSSFSLFVSLVTNSPVADKTLSGSTDLGLIEIKTWNRFSGLFHFFVASKRRISFITICDRFSSCAGIV